MPNAGGSKIARVGNHIERQLAVERTRDALIDAEIVVDDARQEVENAAAKLRAAVRERDRITAHLVNVIHAAKVA